MPYRALTPAANDSAPCRVANRALRPQEPWPCHDASSVARLSLRLRRLRSAFLRLTASRPALASA